MSAPVAVDVEVAPGEHRSVLGQWDSAVTSYYLVLGASGLLLAIGLVMVLSSSTVDSLSITDGRSPYYYFLNQTRYALVGLPLAWLASRLPIRAYRTIAWPGLLAMLGVQALVPHFGKIVNGNRNWLVIGGQTIQPSEMLKLALALWLGVVLARKRALLGKWLHVLVPGVLVALAGIGLVLLGGDLGTAMIMMILVAGALFVAGVPMWMFGVAAVAGGLVVTQLAQATSSRVDRIQAFFSPNCDPHDACYQTTRGLMALASGSWTGVGLGQSREKWSYLPERHSDFIFAILGEELGLLGTVLVLLLFGVLAFAMVRIIRRHADPVAQIATAGIAAWVLGQALINIAVVIGLLPVLGVPLPLVSAGDSALITTMVALGVVVSFARTEPGAAEALSARPSVVRRSLAVIGRSAVRARGARG